MLHGEVRSTEVNTMRRLTLLPAAMLAVLLAAAPAAADSTYQTERLTLAPVAGGSGSGMVVNAHANGPEIYAHEQYRLAGAEPNETYEVWLLLGPNCDALAPAVNTASITTNAAGNGAANYVFTFDFVDSLGVRGMTFAGAWQVLKDEVVVYQTGCTSIELD